jgi:hypothetical protein
MPSIPPAGITPASAFVVASYPPQEPPTAILADRINPLTGEFESLLEGRGLADAMLIQALRVQRGTGAAVRDVGNRFREITHIDGRGLEVITSMVREAAGHAERAGVVRVVRVTVEPDASDPSELNAAVEYKDLLAPADAPTRRLVFSR